MAEENLNSGMMSTPVSPAPGSTEFHFNGFHHPDFDPVAFAIGPVSVRWYSLAYLFGILLGWFYIMYINRKYGHKYFPEKALESLPLWIVISIVLGGRIGYVLFYNFSYYSHNLTNVYKIWEGGMSFHGGLTGVIIGMIIFSRVYKLKFFKITDYLAAATPFGLFFGRIANFINKELIGAPTNVKWAVIYPNEDFGRHPSQLYEAGMEGILLFIILFVAMKWFGALDKKGTLSGLFLIFYGIFRMVAELFRLPDKQIGYLHYGLTMGQYLCLPMILAGIIIFLFAGNEKKIES